MSLEKVAIITGASRGIGQKTAIKLAQNGFDIAVCYTSDEEGANKTVEDVRALGRQAFAFKCDVANFEETSGMINQIIEKLGRVDVLVNNAGVVRDKLLLSMREEDFDRVIEVNLKGTFNMTRGIYPLMMRQRFGRIINITSVVGLSGNAGQSNYAAAKAGIIGFTKSIAKELSRRGVTCNAIAPGYIETDMTNAIPDAAKEAIISNIPVQRVGSAEDVAAAVAFLASDEAAYITGIVLPVDGGLSM